MNFPLEEEWKLLFLSLSVSCFGSLIDLQCYISFKYTAKWFRYINIYTHTHTHIYIYIQMLFPYRLLQNIGYCVQKLLLKVEQYSIRNQSSSDSPISCSLSPGSFLKRAMQFACLLPPGICLTIPYQKGLPKTSLMVQGRRLHCSGRVFHLGAGSSTCCKVCPKKRPSKTSLFQQHLPPTKIPHSSSCRATATIRYTVDSVYLCCLPLHWENIRSPVSLYLQAVPHIR